MYLFDTDALSQIIRKSPSISFIKKLALVPPRRQFTTAITVGEMGYGAHKSDRPAHFLSKLNHLVWPNIQILPFGKESAEIYGKIRAELEKKGTPLTEPDMRIASIALCHKLVLVTGNVKHFSRISGLTIDNWLKT